MGLLDKLRRKKKKETQIEVKSEEVKSNLEELCGSDKETYEALFDTMFLDPRKTGVSMEEAAEKAKKFEKDKDLLNARMWYEIAGAMAIYEGNVKKVKEYFGKCEKLSPNKKYKILENPEKAVAKAQEYYKKYLT